MGVTDWLTKARDTITGTRSMATQARLINEKPAAPSQVPAEVQTAMDQQGMTAGGTMSPGAPISPYNEVGTAPLVRPFQVGQNIFAVPREMDGVGFDALKGITRNWDIATLCIQVRQDEIRNLDWDIVVDEDMVENADLYKSEIKAAKDFFTHPAEGMDLDDLVMMSSDDWLRYDAMCLFRHRTRNGKLGELEVIDGTTLSPLIDGRGAIPRGDAPAYVQWAWGLPWVWLKQRDVIYKPHHPRPSTRYGLPPAEWLLLTGNTDVRLQWYFLRYFTEGEVPEAFINAPPDVSDPKQVQALQDAYEAVMSGKRGGHHKVKWIPPGAKVTTVNKANFDVNFAAHLIAKGCAGFKVQPAQIGFTEKVNKSSGETQREVTYQRSIIPSVQYYQSIFNKILREDFNMPYARFKYLNIEEEEDQLKLAQTRQIYIASAVLSPDEVRQELGYDVDVDAPVGRFVSDRTGLIFVDAASQEAARKQGNLADEYNLGINGYPEGDGKLLDPRSAVVAPAIKPAPPKPNIAPTKPGSDPQGTSAEPADTQNKAVEDELRKWRQAALKRAKDGRLQKAWQPEHIDPYLHKALSMQLSGTKTAEDVRGVFDTLLGGEASNFTKREARSISGGVKVSRNKKKLQATQEQLKIAVEVVLAREGKQVAEQVAAELLQMAGNQGASGANGAAVPTAAGVGAGTAESASSSTASGASSAGVGSAAVTGALAADGVPIPTGLSVEALVSGLPMSIIEADIGHAVQESLKAIFEQAATEGVQSLGVSLAWDYVNPLAIKYAEDRAAELVGKKRLPDGVLVDNGSWSIPETTRNMIREHVVAAVKDGQTIAELQQGIQEHYAFSSARAETIARTETGTAYNRGGVGGWRAVGVMHVEVFDGDYDGACAAANGSIWTLAHAEADPLQHPRCVRSFAPIPPDEDTLAPGAELPNPNPPPATHAD
ncbi:phage portal protein [Alicyclobacillus sp. ALC3]|uniref:phage portal protein n=1 Tax=Alicyclobacillus sp. ALC3 TaxID=2796143 RepID=UPI00237954BD|nr:phage portal protein [Alicyclobacillus sp. ALC3]WDL97808.1 phage portal protein [Alicyclobacillus sp. ALC3]